jgi:hypothetical protein
VPANEENNQVPIGTQNGRVAQQWTEKMQQFCRLSSVALVLLTLTGPAVGFEKTAVTLKVSAEKLNSLPDNYVDDLCRAATLICMRGIGGTA